MITAYSVAKSITKEYFVNNILTQPLWENSFITIQRKRKVFTLNFKSWIDSGILYIGNLRFINGAIDETYVHRKLTKKNNILSELYMLKQALKPYAYYLGNHEPIEQCNVPVFNSSSNEIYAFKSCKSRFFYHAIVDEKLGTPQNREVLMRIFDIDEVNLAKAFERKISSIKDKKLCEFNFKILHNILPCNVNLVKWKKRNCEMCKLCNVAETIEHLLYNCSYANGIWNDFKQKTGFNICYKDIVIGSENSPRTNWLVTLIAYAIFVKWCAENLHNAPRSNIGSLQLVEHYVKSRTKLYQHIGWEFSVEFLFN